MSTAYICFIAATLLGLSACTRGSENTATPATPQPAEVQGVKTIAPPTLKIPVPVAKLPKPAAPPDASLALDLDALKKQLKETKAIGIFSKIALKNQVDDLMDRFHQYYKGKSNISLTELHRSFDLLMMKVLSLIQDNDRKLASAILSSRDAIWNLLADPKKFATLES